MTPTLRVVLIVVSILTTFMIMPEDPAVKTPDRGFDFLAGILVHSHCVQYLSGAADLLAELAGTYTTANFIYLAVIFLLIVKMFHMSIKQSQLETKIKDLAQKIALDENERGKEAQTSVKRLSARKTNDIVKDGTAEKDDASYVLKNELKYLHKKEIEKWERLK